MIRSLPTDGVAYLVGGSETETSPLPPYSDQACAFLGKLAKQLRANPAAKPFPDILTFAFWCRTGNVSQLRDAFGDSARRLGRGMALHIAPANVPVNFAFSLAFGLLAGNANVVRVASTETPQTKIICDAIREVLTDPEFDDIRAMTAIVHYPSDSDVSEMLSAISDARIVWGGDQTIQTVRALRTPPKCVDLAFADRYSFCVLGSEAVANADATTLTRLARDFYNDSYLMDQNACSSPHLVVWSGSAHEQAARERFWAALDQVVTSEYELAAVHAVDKYTAALKAAIDVEEVTEINRHGIDVIRVGLSDLPTRLDETRGRFGMFFEYVTDDVSDVADAVTQKFQTVTYFGVDRMALADIVVDTRLNGIDRIVPVGRALAIDVMWDGYDVVSHLSRVVAVE